MRLVQHDELEGDVVEHGLLVLLEHLVGGDQDMELVDLVGLEDAPFGGDVGVVPLEVTAGGPAFNRVRVVVKDAVKVGPVVPGPLPVLQGGEGRDYKERPSYALEGVQVVEEGHALDRLAQPHLISEDHVPVVVPGTDEPVQALQLVVSEQAPVLVHRLVLHVVLEVLLLGVVVVQLLLDLHDLLLVLLALVLTGVLLVLEQGLVALDLGDHVVPRLLVQSSVEHPEIVDFLGGRNHALLLPARLQVTQVLPLDQVQLVDLLVEVHLSELLLPDVDVLFFFDGLGVGLLVFEPGEGELARVVPLDLLSRQEAVDLKLPELLEVVFGQLLDLLLVQAVEGIRGGSGCFFFFDGGLFMFIRELDLGNLGDDDLALVLEELEEVEVLIEVVFLDELVEEELEVDELDRPLEAELGGLVLVEDLLLVQDELLDLVDDQLQGLVLVAGGGGGGQVGSEFGLGHRVRLLHLAEHFLQLFLQLDGLLHGLLPLVVLFKQLLVLLEGRLVELAVQEDGGLPQSIP